MSLESSHRPEGPPRAFSPTQLATSSGETRALILLAASAALFGGMAVAAKLATATLSGAQVAVLRFVVAALPLLLVPRHLRRALEFRRLDLIVYRGLFGGLAVLLYFLAIEHIPVGMATLLNYSAPVWSTLFAALFLRERLDHRILLPFAVALGGVVLVVRAHAAPGELLGFGVWELAGLGSSVLSGAAVASIRGARRTENSWSIYASFTLFGLVAALPFGIWEWRQPSLRDWFWLVAVGALSIGAQLLMTHAYRWVDNLRAGVLAQLAVVVSMALGALFLGERFSPLGLLGSALTIGGVAAVLALGSPPSRADPLAS